MEPGRQGNRERHAHSGDGCGQDLNELRDMTRTSSSASG
jgi:hypothetical protein